MNEDTSYLFRGVETLDAISILTGFLTCEQFQSV
jgi:hypothetical protein